MSPIQPPRPLRPPPRRTRNGWIIAAVAGVVALGMIWGAATVLFGPRQRFGTGSVPSVVMATTPAGHEIRLEVTSSSGVAARIEWHAFDDRAIATAAPTPWRKDYQSTTRLGFASIKVVASGSETVGCKIFVDGVLADEGSSQESTDCYVTTQ